MSRMIWFYFLTCEWPWLTYMLCQILVLVTAARELGVAAALQELLCFLALIIPSMVPLVVIVSSTRSWKREHVKLKVKCEIAAWPQPDMFVCSMFGNGPNTTVNLLKARIQICCCSGYKQRQPLATKYTTIAFLTILQRYYIMVNFVWQQQTYIVVQIIGYKILIKKIF